MIAIAIGIQTTYDEDKQRIVQEFGEATFDLCSWFAICRYYKCECECYAALLRMNSSLRVIQCCVDLLLSHFSLEIEPIQASADEVHQLLFDSIILQAEVSIGKVFHVDLL